MIRSMILFRFVISSKKIVRYTQSVPIFVERDKEIENFLRWLRYDYQDALCIEELLYICV